MATRRRSSRGARAAPEVRLNARTVAVAAIQPNPWNPNMMSEELFQATRESIRENGFVDPVTVRTLERGRSWQIIDGEHRWKAAQAEGMAEVSINDLGEITDEMAQRLTVIFMQHGEPDEVLLGRVVARVFEAFGKEGKIPGLSFEQEEIDALIKIAGADLPELGSIRPGALERITVSFRCTAEEAETVERAISAAMKGKGQNARAEAAASSRTRTSWGQA